MRNNIEIKVTQNDLLDNVETVVYQGIATLINDDIFHLSYKENENTEVEIKVEKEDAYLSRISEANTKIHFNETIISEASLNSELGNMKLDVKTEEITLKKDNLVIGYSLMQHKNIVSKFIMKVEWMNE